MHEKSLKKNLILNYIKTITGILFPMITFPYATRILLTEGMGKVKFVYSIIVYLQLIASLGIYAYAIREGTKYRDDKEKISKFASEMLCINLLSMVVSYIIMFVILLLPKMQPYRTELLLYSLVLFFGVIGVDWLYSIYEDFAYITIRAVLFQVLSLVLLFLLVKKPEDTNKYILITVISAAGSSVFNIVHSRIYVKWFSDRKTYQLKRHMKPILILFGMTLATKVYLNMDTIMITMMKGDHYSGLYSAAVQMNSVLSTVITAISGVTLPRLSLYIGKNHWGQFQELVKKTMHYLMFATIPTIIGLFFISKNVIVLVCGEPFVDASITMKIMLPNLFCSIMNGFIAYQIFTPCGKEKWAFMATIAGAIINFILNSLLIPIWAQNGAAIATVLTEMVIFIICVVYSKKLLDIRNIFHGIYKYFVASVAYPVIYYGLVQMGIKGNLAMVVLEISLGTIGYLLLLLVIKCEFMLNILNEVGSFWRKRKNG